MLSLMGPGDLKLWLDARYLLGKEYSRGFLHNTHTYENPLELFKYYWRDSDGVAGTDVVAAAVLTPGIFDTSLRTKKSESENLPFTATHHALMVERRSPRSTAHAEDILLTEPNLKMLEARVWYELYLVDDKVVADEGLVSEFPPGFGLEGDFTVENASFYRTGMNNLSVVRPLPGIVKMDQGRKIIRAVLRPVHGTLGFAATGGAEVGCVGIRSLIHWFKAA